MGRTGTEARRRLRSRAEVKRAAQACGAALGLGLAVGVLTACGGGGGGGSVVVPPPSPPPAAPPPGASTSGGTVSSAGAFQGAFSGPSSFVLLPPTGGRLGSSTPARADRTVVVAPTTGQADQPTVTITLAGSRGGAFDFDGAAARAYGLVTTRSAPTAAPKQEALTRVTFDLGGKAPFYGALYSYDGVDMAAGASSGGLAAVASIGADRVTMPSSGQASFDTGFYGKLLSLSSPDGDYFFGRGRIDVSFATGKVTGGTDDVDFIDRADGAVRETAPGGIDLALSIDAAVSGDAFAGDIVAAGVPDLTGRVFGDFYGPADAAPVEIGGAFVAESADAAAVGGFLGIKE